jgi:hypothetical protein
MRVEPRRSEGHAAPAVAVTVFHACEQHRGDSPPTNMRPPLALRSTLLPLRIWPSARSCWSTSARLHLLPLPRTISLAPGGTDWLANAAIAAARGGSTGVHSPRGARVASDAGRDRFRRRQSSGRTAGRMSSPCRPAASGTASVTGHLEDRRARTGRRPADDGFGSWIGANRGYRGGDRGGETSPDHGARNAVFAHATRHRDVNTFYRFEALEVETSVVHVGRSRARDQRARADARRRARRRSAEGIRRWIRRGRHALPGARVVARRTGHVPCRSHLCPSANAAAWGRMLNMRMAQPHAVR